VSASVAFSASVFLQNLALASEQLQDTAGTRLQPTHLFTTSDFFNYYTRLSDNNGRPFLPPETLLMDEPQDELWEAWTGLHMPGSLRWWKDDNIPAIGGNTQIVVCRPQEIYTFDGERIPYAYPEYLANQLTVILGLRAYVSTIPRFKNAIAVISGGTYPTSLI
jgi:hypothetical protein